MADTQPFVTRASTVAATVGISKLDDIPGYAVKIAEYSFHDMSD